MAKKKTIVLCSSANFYEHVIQVSDALKQMGFKTQVPITANKMRRDKNYNAADYRVWYKDPKNYNRKTFLMNNHFAKVAKSDAILVINDEKRGLKGYMGANSLMEMGLAFYLKKPIFVLNAVGNDLPYYEEVKAMNSVILNGKLDKINL
jgi:nucleoside 2-deoxyribosyltransferase